MVDRVIRVVIDPSDALVGARQVNRALETTGQRVSATRGSFAGLTAQVRAFAGALAVNEIRQFADTATLLENRLRLVTDSTAELNAVSDELFNLSQQTRTSFEGSVELFARVARSTEQLGISQREVIDLTRAVNQAVQISGATAQEASNAIIQFSQGLASGALRGEELRSVLEQVPRLAIALADGLNLSAEALAEIEGAAPEDRIEVTIGLLRELGAEGELTTERIVDAISRIGPELQEEFEQLNRTSDQALVQLRNSFLRLVDELDDELDFSSGITGAIDLVRDFVDGITERVPQVADAIQIFSTQIQDVGDDFEAVIEIAEDFGQTINEIFGLDDATAEFTSALQEDFPAAFRELERLGDDTIGFLIDSLAALPANVASVVRIATTEIAAGFTRLRFEINETVLTSDNIFSQLLAGGQDLLGALGGEDVETFLGRLEADAIAADAALAEFRRNESARLREDAEERERIREENRRRREEEARSEAEARRLLDEPGERRDTATFDPAAQQDAEKLLERLKEQTEELRLQNEFGLVAEQIGRRNAVTELERAGAAEQTIRALRNVTNELALQEAIEEELANQAEDAETISALETELELLTATRDRRFEILAAQQLSVDATDEQIAKTAELLEKIEDAEAAQKSQLITLEEIEREFARGVGDAIGNFLQDVDGSFDSLRQSFADLLSDLAIEILKNIIVTQFFQSFLGFGTGAGPLSFLGGLAGAQEGRGLSRGEPIIVGEKEPEIFVPTQAGTVVPGRNVSTGGGDVVILNDPNPSDVLTALQTRQGARVQRNKTTADERKTKRQLGLLT